MASAGIRMSEKMMMASTPRRRKGWTETSSGQIGGLADFEEGVLGADFAVFGKVAAGLAHHPDGEARNGFAAASAEEELFAAQSGGLGSHR